jgi:cell wall-associated NlpC family hydrolase
LGTLAAVSKVVLLKTMIAYAMTFLNQPYKWGGDDPVEGYDCSGLVQDILASVGCDPPGDQTSQGLYNHFAMHGVQSRAGAGALVFYGKNNGNITHVAFMIDDRRIIEAAGGDRRTQTREDAASQNAFVRIRPYTYRRDVVAIMMPAYPVWVAQGGI